MATALICASEKGHLEIVQVLLEARAATDLTNKLDNTALVRARGKDHLEIARLLVEAGAAAGPMQLCTRVQKTSEAIAAMFI